MLFRSPSLPRVNVLLAFNYMAAGRCRDAIPLLAANFEVESEPSIRLLVGQRLVECYFATADEEHAMAVVQKLRQIAPDDPDVLSSALKAYMKLWSEAFQRLGPLLPGNEDFGLADSGRDISGLQLRGAGEIAGSFRQLLPAKMDLAHLHQRGRGGGNLQLPLKLRQRFLFPFG